VYLGQAIACGFDPVAMASLFAISDEKVSYFPICEAIMFPKQNDWSRVYGLIMSIPEDEVESARWMILSYAKSCMKNQKNAERGARVIQAMKSPFFDSKLAGFLSNYYLVWSKNV
jgi:hypothetical protein